MNVVVMPLVTFSLNIKHEHVTEPLTIDVEVVPRVGETVWLLLSKPDARVRGPVDAVEHCLDGDGVAIVISLADHLDFDGVDAALFI